MLPLFTRADSEQPRERRIGGAHMHALGFHRHRGVSARRATLPAGAKQKMCSNLFCALRVCTSCRAVAHITRARDHYNYYYFAQEFKHTNMSPIDHVSF